MSSYLLEQLREKLENVEVLEKVSVKAMFNKQ